MYFRCVIATRCRAVTLSARALASVHAAETIDISASAAGLNAEQSLARAKHPINMLLKRRRERCRTKRTQEKVSIDVHSF